MIRLDLTRNDATVGVVRVGPIRGRVFVVIHVVLITPAVFLVRIAKIHVVESVDVRVGSSVGRQTIRAKTHPIVECLCTRQIVHFVPEVDILQRIWIITHPKCISCSFLHSTDLEGVIQWSSPRHRVWD